MMRESLMQSKPCQMNTLCKTKWKRNDHLNHCPQIFFYSYNSWSPQQYQLFSDLGPLTVYLAWLYHIYVFFLNYRCVCLYFFWLANEWVSFFFQTLLQYSSYHLLLKLVSWTVWHTYALKAGYVSTPYIQFMNTN